MRAEAAMSATWGGGNRCTEEAAVSWLIHQCKPGADMRNDAPVHTQRREERRRETEAHLSPETASLTPNCRGGEAGLAWWAASGKADAHREAAHQL